MATNYIKLEWSNSCDLGRVYYAGGFTNKIFLEGNIGSPEYTHEDEGYYNSNGEFIKTFERLVKFYRFKVLVPEYVADALNFMKLHDTITLSTTDGLYSSQITNVEVNTIFEPITTECLSEVEIKFRQDDQIEKSNCCVNMS